MSEIPCFPDCNEIKFSSTLFPMEEMMPIPVMAIF
jgi:hypothetical protein